MILNRPSVWAHVCFWCARGPEQPGAWFTFVLPCGCFCTGMLKMLLCIGVCVWAPGLWVLISTQWLQGVRLPHVDYDMLITQHVSTCSDDTTHWKVCWELLCTFIIHACAGHTCTFTGVGVHMPGWVFVHPQASADVETFWNNFSPTDLCVKLLLSKHKL